MDRILTSYPRVDNRVGPFMKFVIMCAACKKIRGDDGRWGCVDRYTQRMEDAAISHGICPECAKALYPDYCR